MSSQSPPSTNPDYDFILKDQPQPKKSFRLPSSGLKTALLVLGAIFVITFLIVILAALLKPKAGGAQQLVNIDAQAQEIARVSKVVETLTQNSDTQGLIATAEASLGSDQAQLGAYFKKAGIKANTKSLAVLTDKKTDTQMQTAAQNNSLDAAYAAYLKKSLTAYKNSINSAYPNVSATAKNILKSAYQSVQTLLAAPQVARSSGS